MGIESTATLKKIGKSISEKIKNMCSGTTYDWSVFVLRNMTSASTISCDVKLIHKYEYNITILIILKDIESESLT